MEQKSLRELYEMERLKTSPSTLFIQRIANTCAVTEATVRGWLSGCARPGKAVCLLLEREFETPWQVLFPELANEEYITNQNTDKQ